MRRWPDSAFRADLSRDFTPWRTSSFKLRMRLLSYPRRVMSI